MLANRKVLRAAIGIPLCLLGIILIFGLKPQSGSTITGLAVLTAVVQALGAIGILLFYSALSDVPSRKSARKIMVEILEKGPLMEAARLLGRHALIDTRPNPEHSSEWIENTTGIVDFFPDEFHRTA